MVKARVLRPVRFRRTNNRWVHASSSIIHGQGLFARVDIPAGELVVEYDGPRIPTNEGKRMAKEGNVYVFQANRREFIDGSVAWNLARHANHSCAAKYAERQCRRAYFGSARDGASLRAKKSLTITGILFVMSPAFAAVVHQPAPASLWRLVIGREAFMDRIAAIDIGSNTIHMVIMDLAGSGLPQHRSSESVILKVGRRGYRR